MKKVTVSLRDEQLERLSQRQEEGDADSRSDALRQILDEYEDLHTEYEQLHTQCEELREELKQERNRNKMILEQREEHTELVKYVQEERTAEQKWREAGIGQRLKWKIFGMDDD